MTHIFFSFFSLFSILFVFRFDARVAAKLSNCCDSINYSFAIAESNEMRERDRKKKKCQPVFVAANIVRKFQSGFQVDDCIFCCLTSIQPNGTAKFMCGWSLLFIRIPFSSSTFYIPTQTKTKTHFYFLKCSKSRLQHILNSN